MNMTLDSTAVSMLAGAGLSLVFSYIPPLQDWYAGLAGAGKRALMGAAVLLAAGISFGLACSGWLASFGYQMSCDQPGLAGLVQAVLGALAANQATYLIAAPKNGG